MKITKLQMIPFLMRKPLLVAEPVSERREFRRGGGTPGKFPSRNLIDPCAVLKKGSYFT